MDPIRNERGVVLSWLVKVLVFLTILGIIGYDAGVIAVNKVTLDSSADEIAVAISVTIGSTPTQFFTEQEIWLMAREEVKDPLNGVDRARVARKGTYVDDSGVVHVRLRRKAETLFAHLIPPLRSAINAYGDGTAGTN